MQNDNTNQRGDEPTLPLSNDHKEQPLPISTNDRTMIAQVDVEVTEEEFNRSQVNLNVENQTDGYVHDAGNQSAGITRITEEEFNRSPLNVENQRDSNVHETVNHTAGVTHITKEEFNRSELSVGNQRDGNVHEAVNQTAGVTQITKEEFNRSQLSVETQRDGKIHEAVTQTARSGDVGVVFEGRTYSKRIFDELLNQYVYVLDEDQ